MDNLQQGTLLEELQQGREAALKKLFDQYYMPLCLYSLQITDSFDVSQDIVQDFFISFWEKRIYNHVSENLKGYLFLSIRNASLAVIRKNKVILLEEVEEEAYSLPDDEYSEEELVRKQERLYQELQTLPKQGRIIFQEIIMNRRKYKEVAEELGISVNSVKTHLGRSLKQLRGSLEDISTCLLFLV